MIKRLLAMLLCALMALALLPTTALADDTPNYTLYYNVEDNSLRIGNTDGDHYTDQNDKWEGKDLKLTLKGFSFTTSAAVALWVPDRTEIVLEGNNTVTSIYFGNGASYAIDCSAGRLTFSGSGTLTATGGTSTTNNSYGVLTNGAGNITVNGDCRITGIGGAAQKSYGVFASEGISVKNGGSITGTGGTGSSSYGVYITGENGGGITVNGGSITGTGGTGGIRAEAGAVSLTNSTVSAEGATAIYGVGITVNGGKVTATSTTMGGNGLYAQNNSITINGGEVTARATGENSWGIYADNASVTVKRGTVTATGVKGGVGTGGVNDVTVSEGATLTATGGASTSVASYGVRAGGSIDVNGSTLTATGGTATNVDSYGVYADGGITVDDGSIEGTGGGGANTANSYGVRSKTDITLDGGSIKGTGGAAQNSYGVCTENNESDAVGITVRSGSINGTGGAATGNSFGVTTAELYGNITVSGGSITGKGGNASSNSYGVHTGIGHINVSGGSIEGTGGEGILESCGVHANTNITASGGSIEGTGGTVTGNTSKSIGLSAGNKITASGTTITGRGGQATDAKNSIGFTLAEELTSGRLVGEVKPGGRLFLSAANLHLPSAYYWRTSESGDYTKSTAQPYVYEIPNTQTYVDIRTDMPTIAFTAQPATSTTVTAGSISGNLTAAAGASFGISAPALNWYACDASGVLSGSSLGTGGTFAIPTTLTAGTYHYLCQATYANETPVNSSVAAVTVNAPAQAVTSVTVDPTTVSIEKGGNYTFTATVTGTNGPAQTVNWSVTGGTSASTAISTSGVLSVGSDEAASSLTVKAASTVDTSKSGMATVTVTTPPAPDPDPDPEPEPDPIPSGGDGGSDYTPATVTVYNDPVQPKATVWLSGSGLAADDQLITKPNPQTPAFTVMRTVAGKNEVVATYDISLQSGKKSTGSAMSLTFDLDVKHSGKEFTLVHQKADGTFEYFYAVADSSGKLVFNGIYSLSPFMLVKGRIAQTAYTSMSDLPKTGDNSMLSLWLGLALIAGAGLAASLACRKRQNG